MLELCWKCGYDHLPPVGENCTGLVKPRIVLRSRSVTGRSKDIITVQTAHEGEGAMAEGTSNVTPAEPDSEELSLIAELQEAERCQRKLRLKARIKELLIWERIWEKGPIGNFFTNSIAEKLPFKTLQTILKYS